MCCASVALSYMINKQLTLLTKNKKNYEKTSNISLCRAHERGIELG